MAQEINNVHMVGTHAREREVERTHTFCCMHRTTCLAQTAPVIIHHVCVRQVREALDEAQHPHFRRRDDPVCVRPLFEFSASCSHSAPVYHVCFDKSTLTQTSTYMDIAAQQAHAPRDTWPSRHSIFGVWTEL
jgi:hypothetical protein